MTSGPVVLLGHVDHGKSALFRALAGNPRQRENARGNTVDFSAARLSDTLTLIDVPGHRDYRANTFAAVTGADAFVLVVAADEGPKPQTWDHLAFARAAGLTAGILLWTKTDRISADDFAKRREALSARGEALEEFVPGDVRVMSAATRESLLARLQRLVAKGSSDLAEHRLEQRGWLWVDRAFVSRTGGRVVTGTWRGDEELAQGATLFAGPGETFRTRQLERAGETVARIRPGERAALAIAGEGALSRGSRLVSEEAIRRSVRVDVRCAGERWRAGTSCEVWLGPHGLVTTVDALRGNVARLRFPRPVSAAVGDRLVVRDGAGEHTIGYATVLEPEPALPFRKVAAVVHSEPLDAFGTFVARRGVVDAATWRAFSLRRRAPAISVNESRLDEALTAVVDGLERAERPLDTRTLRQLPAVSALSPSLDAAFWEALCRRSEVGTAAGWWWLKKIETGPGVWSQTSETLLRRMAAGTLGEATTQERAIVSWLVAIGRVVKWDDATYEPVEGYWKFLESVRSVFAERSSPWTLGELRDRLGLSRREAVRRFEALDRWGVTARSGDGRTLISSDRVPSPD